MAFAFTCYFVISSIYGWSGMSSPGPDHLRPSTGRRADGPAIPGRRRSLNLAVDEKDPDAGLARMSLVEHLRELRRRLMIVIIAMVVGGVGAMSLNALGLF